jgi:hypothetical protein
VHWRICSYSECVQYAPNMRLRSSLPIVVDLPSFATATFFGTPNFDAACGKSSGPGGQILVNFGSCKCWFLNCWSQILILANSDFRNSGGRVRRHADCPFERRTKSS